MDISFLHEYIVFSRSLNYAKAARELYLSEPTLRSHIRSLEAEIGVDLATKRADRIVLTPAGRFFLTKARELVENTEDVVEHTRAVAQQSVSLLVSFLECRWVEDLFLKARERYCSNHPDSTLEFLFSSSMSANWEALQNGQVDITVYPAIRESGFGGVRHVPPSTTEGTSVYLGSCECQLWMGSRNRLFGRNDLCAADLEGMTLLLGNTPTMNAAASLIAQHFSDKGIAIKTDNQPFATYTDYLLSNGAETFGITLQEFDESRQAREGFHAFRLSDLSLTTDIYAICDESRLSEQARGFVHALADVVEDKNKTAGD